MEGNYISILIMPIFLGIVAWFIWAIVKMKRRSYVAPPPPVLTYNSNNFSETKQRIINLISDSITAMRPAKDAHADALKIAGEGQIIESDLRDMVVYGWEKAVDIFFEDNILSSEENESLENYKDYYEFGQDDLDKRGYWTKLVKGAVLRDILEGKIPERVELNGSMPFILGKDEKLIWYFPKVHYLEDKIKREYVGRTQGVSVKVMKGVYYRTGGFKGNPIDTTVTAHIGTGVLAITDKNLLFASSNKSVKIPFKKILSLMPYEDGVQISRDTASAKPQYFLTGDGWFTQNLISNLIQN
jgi:hypothetical protein